MVARVIVASLVLLFAYMSVAQARPYWFSSTGCDFVVVFPSEPTITNFFLPGVAGEFGEAQISDERGLMRAFCVGIGPEYVGPPIPFYADRDALLKTLQAYMVQNGVGNLTYTYKIGSLGVEAEARGTKFVSSRWITVVAIWFVSPESVMAVLASHLSRDYPTPDIVDFFQSVSRR